MSSTVHGIATVLFERASDHFHFKTNTDNEKITFGISLIYPASIMPIL